MGWLIPYKTKFKTITKIGKKKQNKFYQRKMLNFFTLETKFKLGLLK